MKPTFRAQGDSFVIDNYNHAPPFASFFPALAGETGKPLWLFFTNRGQGISSFGVNNKDGAMLEFLPANKAYQATPLLGFRTFVRSGRKQSHWYEPFSVSNTESQQSLIVRPYELILIDVNRALGVEIQVHTYGVPNESCPALARSLTIKNLKKAPLTLNVIDGLPRVVPWGMGDYLVKNMSRTIEAFAEVANDRHSVPFFKLKVEPDDKPDVQRLKAGFFSITKGQKDLLPIIVDPSIVFGHDSSFLQPSPGFGSNGFSYDNQLRSNIMPASFYSQTVTLKPGESQSWDSFYGYTPDEDEANRYAERVKNQNNYFGTKRNEIKDIYENLVKKFGLKSGIPALDAYANNTFMDNVLRGGFPVSITPNGPLVHLFSRKHGDMERDYNSFQISATYFSQGNGNFRDVNQNRRHDVLLNPKTGSTNLEFFFNLIQLDGYNPLIINPVKFTVPRDLSHHPELKITDELQDDFIKLQKEPILPGQLYEFILKHAQDKLNVNNIFKDVIQKSRPQQGIQHGEGYWIDHWTYNLDHLDQYFSVFPDQKQNILFEKKDFTFHESDHYVKPRREKYFITKEGKIRQYGSVGTNREKQVLISSRKVDGNKVRLNHGRGEVLKTTLFIKLLSLAVVKTSTLDPYGVGIEMEADKPGWCDALNGCPGLFGSSTHELFELIRLTRFILNEAVPLSPTKGIEIPNEIYTFIREVGNALAHHHGKDFRVTWDKMTTAREHFREKTLLGISGKFRTIKMSDIKSFCEKALKVLTQAEKKAIDPKTGLPTSYFTYEMDPSHIRSDWRHHMFRLNWKQHRVAPFLEGSVHAMKVFNESQTKKLYQKVRRSELMDKKLKMYRLNFWLKDESNELGRIKVFSRGWLENESIFLHMHYKYLLEILKSEMYDQFFDEIKHGLIPFRDMVSYGRPVFENSSFLASSVFPKKEFHGKGFVARLSGATSEFMSMVYYMLFGPKIFRTTEEGIVFSPRPTLPGNWFTKKDNEFISKNSLTLSLFGIPVTYINEHRKNTYGPGAVQPVGYEWILDGRFYVHEGSDLPMEASLALREGRLEKLTIFLNRPPRSSRTK